MGPWGGFCLGLGVAVLVNFVTALFSREKGVKLIPWLWFYISLHLLAVFLNTDFMRGKVMEIAHNGNHSWPSYAIVMLVAACLAGLYWNGINFAVDKLAAATQDKPAEAKPDEKVAAKKDDDAKDDDAKKKAAKKKPKIEQHSQGDNSPNIHIDQQSSGTSSPNIAQIGNNNQAIVVPRPIPRRLGDDQKAVLQAILGKYPGFSISIHALMDDNESDQYARDFVDVFRAAHWDLGGPRGYSSDLFAGGVPIGVVLGVRSREDSTLSVSPVVDALKAAKITHKGMLDDVLKPGDLELIIGKNPE